MIENQIQKPLNYHSYIEQVRNMYQKPVAQTSSALILTICTIVFFGFAAIKPTLRTVSELIGELDEKKVLATKMQTKLRNLQTAQEQLLKNTDTLMVFDQSLPDNQNLNQFLLSLEYLAHTHNLTINNLRTEPLNLQLSDKPTSSSDQVLKKSIQEIDIRMGLEGDLDKFTNFLTSLNNIRRVVEISSINISQSTETDTPSLVLNISFKTFWISSPTSSSK